MQTHPKLVLGGSGVLASSACTMDGTAGPPLRGGMAMEMLPPGLKWAQLIAGSLYLRGAARRNRTLDMLGGSGWSWACGLVGGLH